MAITENSKELRHILWDGADILRSKIAFRLRTSALAVQKCSGV